MAGNQVRASIIEAAYGLSGAPAAPTLNALTVSPNTATVGTAYSGVISGKTANSTIALVNGDGLAVSGTSITGTPTTAGSLGLVETLAGATGSPRTTSGVVTIAAASQAASPVSFVSPALVGPMTFSNSNRTVKGAGTGTPYRSVALTNVSISGKMMFAATFDSIATNGQSNYGLIGVNTSTVTSAGAGFDANGAALFTGIGQVFANGSSVANIPTPAVGNTVLVYVDLPNAKMWFTKDGSNWYGAGNNVALTLAQVNAGTSGINIATAKAAGTLYFVAGERDQTGFQWTALQAYPFAANTRPTGAVYIGEGQ